MAMKRERESKEPALLANEIRASNRDSVHEVANKTKYIKMQLDNMNEEQLTRFEFFMRSHLSRSKVEAIIANTLGTTTKGGQVTPEMAIVVSGLAKLFVGELMEKSIEVLGERPEDSMGVRPEHISEAYRRMQQEGLVGKESDSSFMLGSGCGGSWSGSAGDGLFSDSLSNFIGSDDDDVDRGSNAGDVNDVKTDGKAC